jgi:hypothetical protein
MNVEVRNEAHLDIAEGVAFYDRQGHGAGDYFSIGSLRTLIRLATRRAFTKSILATIEKFRAAILFSSIIE